MADKQYIRDNKELFNYLFKLQKSGKTNMWGASAYLEKDCGLDETKADEILVFWITNYAEIKKELTEPKTRPDISPDDGNIDFD